MTSTCPSLRQWGPAGTAITTAVTCQRRAWLQERVAGGPGGEAALVGQLSHLLLQRSLHAALEGTLSKENMMAEVGVYRCTVPKAPVASLSARNWT